MKKDRYFVSLHGMPGYFYKPKENETAIWIREGINVLTFADWKGFLEKSFYKEIKKEELPFYQ